jgi:glycosyltransferase involved in cell wall biosynthesis
MLVAQGKDIRLELVGWPESGEKDILENLVHYAEQNEVGDRVVYLGYKAVGPELFECYRNADIYVIASQSSFEGFPRTIWEAMANSMPVVATCVGSIPAFIDGLAELVEPRQPEAIAAGIARLLDSPELRQRYIKGGLELARKNTLEACSQELVSNMEGWLKRAP